MCKVEGALEWSCMDERIEAMGADLQRREGGYLGLGNLQTLKVAGKVVGGDHYYISTENSSLYISFCNRAYVFLFAFENVDMLTWKQRFHASISKTSVAKSRGVWRSSHTFCILRNIDQQKRTLGMHLVA